MTEIRLLEKDDALDDLITLSREFFYEYEGHHGDYFNIVSLEDDHIIRYFTSFWEHETRKAYIAIIDGKIVGYITIYINEQADYWQVKKVGEISGLMVKKEFRRLGIASELMKKAEVFFQANALKYFTVYSAVNNREAIDFYKKCGLHPLYMTLVGEV